MAANGTASSIHAIRSSAVFLSLPAALAEELGKCAVVRNLETGNVLYLEGSEAAYVYLVVRGSLRSVLTDIEGREQTLSVERRGMVLGGVAVFTEGGYTSTMIANEPVTVLRVETEMMKRLCRAHPDWLWSMASALALRVRDYSELASILSLRTVDQKLAFYLVTVAQDRGMQTDEGCLFELTATRVEIAARLGSVREVICRSLGHLQERNLVLLRGRLVTVPNVTALQRFAAGEKPLLARTAG